MRWSCAAAACVALLVAGGCGDSGKADVAEVAPHTRTTEARLAYGRSLFRELCAGCHTLADADAHGQRYDLDGVSLAGPQVWGTMIEGGPGMPAWRKLSEREKSALGLYLLEVAGQGNDEQMWGRQITRRLVGGEPRWLQVRDTIEREIEREAQ